MTEPHERLKIARQIRFSDAAEAARAMGIPLPTYAGHENGSRGLTRSGIRYAKFFRISYEWLMTGKGEMRGSHGSIPVDGLVGAGASVQMIGDSAGVDAPDEIDLPRNGSLRALKIRGDSQWPRFLDGEYILYDPIPMETSKLINKYAIIETKDSRRLIKIIRRGTTPNRWRLESHNAPAEEDVEIVFAWRYLGVLPSK